MVHAHRHLELVEEVVAEEVSGVVHERALSHHLQLVQTQHTGLGLVAHETESAVEEGGLRGGGGHDGDGDGVLTLLQVVHGRIRALGERLDGQRDDVVGHRVIDVLGGGGGAQLAHHAVAEHLVVVQVHDAAELVAERQDNAGEALHAGHVEVLLVELDGVGRFGIGAEGPLRPAGEVRAEPVLRHVVHVVVPLGLEADGIDGGEVARLEAQEAVVTHTRQGLELGAADHGLDV